MGMDFYVRAGQKETDPKWKRLQKVANVCQEAGVPAPREVLDYFGGDDPNGPGRFFRLEDHESKCLTIRSEHGNMYYEVDVTKIPKNVTIIQFNVSW